GGHLGLLIGADPQELAKEQILRVHRDVRLELALPPAFRRLERQQVVDRPVECGLHGGLSGERQNSRSTMKRASPSTSAPASGWIWARSSSRRASPRRLSASSAA